MVTLKQLPFCDNCNTDEHIVIRSGGGYRCEECKRIWDEYYRIIGEGNESTSVEDIKKKIDRSHIGKKNDWLVG
jgi:tRNA(Ile2) C34 agmatinyltransferase TiaS